MVCVRREGEMLRRCNHKIIISARHFALEPLNSIPKTSHVINCLLTVVER